MKDVAFVIVVVLAVLLLVFLTLLQAASQSLKVALIVSLVMGLVCSFLVAMVAYTVDEDLEFDAIYKIMLVSQIAAGLVSGMLSMQPCMEPRMWQVSLMASLQRSLDSITGSPATSFDKSMLKSLNSTNSQNMTDIINMRHLPLGGGGGNGGGNDGPHSNNNRHSDGQVGINLANISYNGDTSNELLKGDVSEVQMTVGDIAISLKEVFYINDLVQVNKALAGKLVKCNLSGSHLMVRAKKEELFDSSE